MSEKSSMAIAYAMKKRAQKMADGGMMKCAHGGGPDCPHCYAEGGDVRSGKNRRDYETGVHKSGSGGLGESTAGGLAKVGKSLHDKGDRARVYGESHAGEGATNKSKELHQAKLEEMKAMKRPNLYADGGEVSDDDMVGRIMQKRMSKGGMTANDDKVLADFKDDDFDDLALRDDLESDYTGENSGDEVGNETHDEEDRDMVSRIMRSRAKKDRLPRPA